MADGTGPFYADDEIARLIFEGTQSAISEVHQQLAETRVPLNAQQLGLLELVINRTRAGGDDKTLLDAESLQNFHTTLQAAKKLREEPLPETPHRDMHEEANVVAGALGRVRSTVRLAEPSQSPIIAQLPPQGYDPQYMELLKLQAAQKIALTNSQILYLEEFETTHPQEVNEVFQLEQDSVSAHDLSDVTAAQKVLDILIADGSDKSLEIVTELVVNGCPLDNDRHIAPLHALGDRGHAVILARGDADKARLGPREPGQTYDVPSPPVAPPIVGGRWV